MSDFINNSLENLKSILWLLGLCWISYFLSLFTPINQYGIHPRTLEGLIGIPFSPFLHGSFSHLIANSSGLLVFGWALGILERKRFFRILIALVFLGGSGTWIFAREANHIGASGLIFGFFGYLLCLGYFQKKLKFILVSLFTLLGYGGMLFGVLPQALEISWESHLFGLLAGAAMAKWRHSRTVDP